MTTITRRVTTPDHGTAFKTSTGLQCNCGAIESDLDAFHLHAVHTWNNPSESAIAARGKRVLRVLNITSSDVDTYRIVECTKVACHNAGNGRECMTLILRGHQPGQERRLYELTAEAAERIARHGAYVNETHGYSFC